MSIDEFGDEEGELLDEWVDDEREDDEDDWW